MDRIVADPNQGLVTETDAMTTLTSGHASQFNPFWLLLLSNDLWSKLQIQSLSDRLSALENGGTGGTPAPGGTGSDAITASFTVANGNSAGVVSFSATATTVAGTITDPTGYQWTLGDGRTATGKNLTVTYPGSGPYNVTLIVTDSSGNTKTLTRQISPPASVNVGEVAAGFTYGRGMGGNSYMLLASASTTSGSNLQYEWNLTSGLFLSLSPDRVVRNEDNSGVVAQDVTLTVKDLTGGVKTYKRSLSGFVKPATTHRLAVKAPVGKTLAMGSLATHVIVYGVVNGDNVTIPVSKKIVGSGGASLGGFAAGTVAVRKADLPEAGMSYALSTNTLTLSNSGTVDLTLSNIQFNPNNKLHLPNGYSAPFIMIYLNEVNGSGQDILETDPMIVVLTSSPDASGTPYAEYPADVAAPAG